MATVTRARRAAIQRAAQRIRMRCQREHHTVERTVTEIRTALVEVTALEAWRLALGWSRADAIEQVAALYVDAGLRPRGLTDAMLCRWEHDAGRWPDDEYTVMLCRAYGARPEQLGLDRYGWASGPGMFRYGRVHTAADDGHGPHEQEPMRMTTDAGLPAVRESLHLALLASPEGSPLVVDLAEAAVEHYALNYSKHPPHVLFEQVRDVRKLLTPALKSGPATEDVRRQVGWLSALLGNLAYHLDDVSGARVHLDTAAAHGARTGDRRLEAWAWGAQSMVTRTSGRVEAAVEHAERGAAAAAPGRVRAQLHAWALLPAFAAAGRGDDADHALATAMNELDTADEPEAPGRFGFDAAELALHQAEAYLALGRPNDARACAESSLAACPSGTPGWAAASLVLAQAETSGTARDAAQRAHDVLDRVPAARLRSTARARLSRLTGMLTSHTGADASALAERLRTLPPPIDAHGQALTS
ncbi:Twin-arginine translocation pathway signal (plasmid) [Streptomyces sp. BB1-1-1]|uniref:Twin-arginine translocation pathway signal n=1 Tax=Streptomyces sp. BB1-1-1 TaxID=3074430 RepID=UPI002877DB00|nr:Twin-arginine translocation pathway signal [Streptomyces sp. BB1-1-1]WND32807.1 Twin-arginine translocation pathway signal [Streptomyces sp. BB1-1-1]WND40125.1 Twin-arginine translocation pathway signal [Streptomyces sp. BB1-1-1]WND40957.1 Twin-arginine translocation pathway signal [Streptomyces sp. BB1-1-1]